MAPERQTHPAVVVPESNGSDAPAAPTLPQRAERGLRVACGPSARGVVGEGRKRRTGERHAGELVSGFTHGARCRGGALFFPEQREQTNKSPGGLGHTNRAALPAGDRIALNAHELGERRLCHAGPGRPSPRPSPQRERGANAFAKPKSKTLTVPSFRTLMFAGLRSRWITPASWAASSASAICLALGSASSSGIGSRPCPVHAARRSP